MNNQNIEITILLPAFNEAEGLSRVVTDIRKILSVPYEIIVVDDGSTDETVLVAKDNFCRVIQYGGNQGKGFAIRAGASLARGHYLIIMDADGTYPVDAIPHIVELLNESDMVRGRRHENREHIPPLNRIGNILFDKTLAIIHGLEGPDHLSGLYGFRLNAFRQLDLKANGFDIETEIGIKVQRKGLRVRTYPINYQPRLGVKKLRPWKDGLIILNRIFSLAILFNPLIFFVVPSLMVLLLSVIGASLLNRGPIITSYFGLSIHSFILANLGVLGAFQLLTFGITTALYGFEFGYKTPHWLNCFAAKPIRIAGVVIGFLLCLMGVFNLASITVEWITSGTGPFYDTQNLILSATYAVWGLQIMSTSLFLSIFSGRIEANKLMAIEIKEV